MLILVAGPMPAPAAKERRAEALEPIASDVLPAERDQPQPLNPKAPRSEEEEERLTALTLYSTARMLEEKQEAAAALRFYERALRMDPKSLSIAREIVPLAFSLGRSAEAVRYALVAAEMDASDPELLERLAIHLTTQGDFERALKLYGQIAALKRQPRPDADSIVMSAQMAKLYLVSGQRALAAKAYRQVMEGLEAKNPPILDARTRRIITDDAAKTLELLSTDVGGRTNEAAAYDLFGIAMLEADDVDGAAAAFAKAKELSPNAALDGYQQAQLQAKRKMWNAVIESLNAYLTARATARGTAPYELLERAMKETGQQSQLTARLQELYQQDSANALLAYYLAEQYRKSGDFDKARPLFESCAQAKPSIQVYRGLLHIYRQTKNAERLLEFAIVSLAAADAADALGDPIHALVADSDLVSKVFALARQRVVQKDQELSLEQLLGLGHLALEAGNVGAANEFFGLALKHGKAEKMQILRRWGLGLVLKEKFADAANVFRRAIDDKLTGDDGAELYYHLAGALAMDGQIDESLTAANKGAELAEAKQTELGEAYYRILSRPPWILYHAKRYAEAAEPYRALIRKFDNSQDNDAARDAIRDARLMLSNIAVMQHDYPQAEEWLEQILDEFPEDVSALNDLGYLWADQGKHVVRALAMIEKAVAAEPKNSAYLDSQGWALFRLGRFEDAVRVLAQAVSLDTEPDAVMLEHLGDAAAAAGKPEQAKDAWSRALKAFEKTGQPDKMKAVANKLQKP